MPAPRGRVVEAAERPSAIAGHWASTLIYAVFSFVLFYFAASARDFVFILVSGFFAAFGVGGLGYMVWRTLEMAKHGETRLLLLAPLPAMGGRLQARLSLPATVLAAGRVRVQLECTRTTQLSKGSHTEPYWRVNDMLPVDGSGLRIVMGIPAELPPLESPAGAPSTFAWVLKVTAALPGIDFSRSFPIDMLPRQPGQPPAEAEPPPIDIAPSVAPATAAEPRTADLLGESSAAARWFLVAVNLVPLYGVIRLGWNVADVVFLYWAENLVIGVMNVARILVAQPRTLATMAKRGIQATPAELRIAKTVLAGFFLMHYGAFCAGHGAFLAGIFGKGQDASGMAREMLAQPLMALGVAVLLLSHGFSLVRNYIGRGEYLRVDVPKMMLHPYRRILVVHLYIFAGGIAIMALKSPAVAVVAFVCIKIAVDLYMHSRERKAFS